MLNSEIIPTFGTTPIIKSRESSTFPHVLTATNDGDTINNYIRKWVGWNGQNSSTIFNMNNEANYNVTGTYKKQVNATIYSNKILDTIMINNTYFAMTYSNYFYDKDIYSVQCINKYRGGLYYQFGHWVYNNVTSYENPKVIYNPADHVNLQLIYKRYPDGRNKNISFGEIMGAPITIYWTDNPHPSVKNRIYRRILNNGTWGSETLLGTVEPGIGYFQDQQYLLTSWKLGDLINYDVRQYFPPDSTFSDVQWVAIHGQLDKQSTEYSLNDIRPEKYSISNYPNPFNPVTKISFSIKENGMTKVQVYDILGNKVADLVSEYLAAGNYETPFDASRLPSGTYIYTIKSNNYSAVKKMLLVK